MSALNVSSPATSTRTGPSPLDIVEQSANLNQWQMSLAAANPSVTSATSLDSPGISLGSVPPFSPESDADTINPSEFTWDASFVDSLHDVLNNDAPTLQELGNAFGANEHSSYNAYPFNTYPMLPVIPPNSTYGTKSTTVQPATINPAATQFVPLSQIAPPPQDMVTTPSPVLKRETVEPESLKATSRATSMDVDEEGDYDDEDLDDEDGADEYKERSRGGRRKEMSSYPTPTESTAVPVTKKGKGKGQGADSNSSQNGSTSTKRRGGTRISVADFVPPDVSGLSKREARLVKNRAAAFLSRQRKREEFETMEVRLARVLEENARLKGSTNSAPSVNNDELERLQEMLRGAEEREKLLKEQLEEQKRLAAQVKPVSRASTPALNVQDALKLVKPMSDSKETHPARSGAHSGPGFSLMVLVFSLTLLSMPHQHQLQANLRGHTSEPVRINPFTPSGSAATFPAIFDNILERWDADHDRVGLLEAVDDDDEMQLEVEPWEAETDDQTQNDRSDSYVVDFEMPVLADELSAGDDGKIRVRIQPMGVPRPRQKSSVLKAGELAWEGSPLPPLGLGTPEALGYAADWESWGGWKEFLSEDAVGGIAALNAGVVDEALSPPRSDVENSVVSGAAQDETENGSERWSTPLSYPIQLEAEEPASQDVDMEVEKPVVDVDVKLSTLPSWSRALVQAAAGEKVKARIRVSRKPGHLHGSKTRQSVALGKKRMGLVVKV